MEDYVKQLLQDIRAAQQTVEADDPATASIPGETAEERAEREMEEYFAEVDRFIEEDPPHSLSYYCGLRPEQFPLAEQLNEEQAMSLALALIQMFRSMNIEVDIPEGFPAARAYPLLLSLLNEHLYMDKWSTSVWSFCPCDPSQCVFAELCPCRSLHWEKDMPAGDADQVHEDNLPF